MADTLKQTIDEERIRFYASWFLGNATGFRGRVAQDMQEDPNVLTADLAWTVMCALCAARDADADLDLDAAVAAGKELFQNLVSDD